jgi:hypothetical protein
METTQTETRAGQGARSDAAAGMPQSSAPITAVPTPANGAVIAIPGMARLRYHREGEVPPDLTAPGTKRWVLWGDGKGPGPDGKLNKKPHAESNQPEKWQTYAEAVAADGRLGASGVGFQLLNAMKILALDLDHVVLGAT